MKRPFAATVWREGNWYVSQCLELDVASQGATEEEALENLKEALQLHFEPPQASRPPKVRTIEVEIGAVLGGPASLVGYNRRGHPARLSLILAARIRMPCL